MQVMQVIFGQGTKYGPGAHPGAIVGKMGRLAAGARFRRGKIEVDEDLASFKSICDPG